MNENIELDTKILNKNLEITRITKQLDDLTSDYVALKERCREQTPIYMIQTLKECHDVIDDSTESGEGLKKDLRRVISFLQQ